MMLFLSKTPWFKEAPHTQKRLSRNLKILPKGKLRLGFLNNQDSEITMQTSNWVPGIKESRSLPLWESLDFLNPGMTSSLVDGRVFFGRVRSMLALILSIAFLVITPLNAYNFGSLVDELSGTEDEEAESEMYDSDLPKKGKKELTPPSKKKQAAKHTMAPKKGLEPTSKKIQATKQEDSVAEDDFAPVKNVVTNGVTLQGLDKQTARVFIIDAHVGQTIEFGTLKLVVHHCERASLENRQESMAFITVTEQKPNTDPQLLFSGWMSSSSPALSSLDHAIYDVWVKECKVLD